jgi:hypothetical protein
MRPLDQVLSDDSTFEALTSEEEFVERWRPLLESLDRMFEDPRQPATEEKAENPGDTGAGNKP